MKVEPASLLEKMKVASVSVVVASGPESREVSGPVVSTSSSTVHSQLGGEASRFPAGSMART
jgi:hypothetical protein